MLNLYIPDLETKQYVVWEFAQVGFCSTVIIHLKIHPSICKTGYFPWSNLRSSLALVCIVGGCPSLLFCEYSKPPKFPIRCFLN